MKPQTSWLVTTLAIATGLAAAASARADVTVDSFDNFSANALYASWSSPAATITPGASSWNVSSIGYGSLWKYEGDINASGASQVKLSLDISGDPGVIAGPIVDLVDKNGVWATFAWYGQTAGSYVLSADVSSAPAAFDWSDIQHIHLECDPGAFQGLYTLNFKDLSVATVPEPTSLALVALGAVGLLAARRRA